MRTKLMLLSALTCITGGSALLAPTAAADPLGSAICENYIGARCTTAGMVCTRAIGGFSDYLICVRGVWDWA